MTRSPSIAPLIERYFAQRLMHVREPSKVTRLVHHRGGFPPGVAQLTGQPGHGRGAVRHARADAGRRGG